MIYFLPGDKEPMMVRLPNSSQKVKLSDCLKAIQKFEAIENFVVSTYNEKAQCFEMMARVQQILTETPNLTVELSSDHQIKIKFRDSQSHTDLRVYEIAL